MVKAVVMGEYALGSALISLFHIQTKDHTLWLYESDEMHSLLSIAPQDRIHRFFGIKKRDVPAYVQKMRNAPIPKMPTFSVNHDLQHGNTVYVSHDPPPSLPAQMHLPPMFPPPTLYAPPVPMVMMHGPPAPFNPHAQFDELCVRYASILCHVSRVDAPLVETFHSSVSQDTDHFAMRILETADYKLYDVEDDAMWIAQHVWDTFIGYVSQEFYIDFRDIMRTIGQPKSQSSSRMVGNIKRAKAAYTDLIRSTCDRSCCLSVPCALGLDHLCCCLFFCCVPVCILHRRTHSAGNRVWSYKTVCGIADNTMDCR